MTPMADATQQADQGILSRVSRAVDTMSPSLERAGLYLMAINHPEVLGRVSQIDAQQRSQWGEIGEDPWTGTKQFGFINPYMRTINGQPMGTNTQGGPALAGINGLTSSASPTQVTQAIQAIQGRGGSVDEQLAQVPDFLRGMVKGAGEYTFDPSKMGGRQKILPMVMSLAQSIYGPQGWDQSQYDLRHKYITGYGNTSPNGLGGQVNSVNTLIDHLAKTSDLAVQLNPSDGLGIPAIAHAINAAGPAFSQEKANAANGLNLASQFQAGEAGRLYSGSSGGGVHERELIRNAYGNARTRGELATALETNRDLLMGKLNEMEKSRDVALGAGSPLSQKYAIMRAQDALEHLNNNIAALRGQNRAAPTTATPPANRPPLSSIFQ